MSRSATICSSSGASASGRTVTERGCVVSVAGPLIVARLPGAVMGSQAVVGSDRVVGEVIRLTGELATLQMYESTELLRSGDAVESSGELLSLELGPGLLGQVFDGIQRPLELLRQQTGDRVRRGASPPALNRDKTWPFVPQLKPGTQVHGGEVLGTIQETALLEHRVLIPPHVRGEIIEVVPAGSYAVETVVARVRSDGREHELRMYHRWPVRVARPAAERYTPDVPLITGQRVLDMLFPLAKGGAAAVPGPFGAGKTILQHQLARWCDGQVIIFVGCGERGNEMVDLLEQFARLTDPHTGRPLTERSVLIANTSNMPVTAREASIYTGITIAEYFRDQGYHVALMADSTSRWAEALREVGSRLEELPAEEGYPAYLGSRLAAFYERSGRVRTWAGGEGSVTVIGSVSPPGGDFSEPVTRHTRSIVGAFWALSKPLADARHYPAIDWDQSFSGYADRVTAWWQQRFHDHWSTERGAMLQLLSKSAQELPTLSPWSVLQRSALGLLREAEELKQIAAIIGPAALSDRQQWTFHAANLVKEGFLQQNALDAIDTFCTPEKQLLLGTIFMSVYRAGRQLIEHGVPCQALLRVPSLVRLKRARTEIPNDRLDLLEKLRADLDTELASVARTEGVEAARTGQRRISQQ
ncbi:MAG: V-type ATP synthase subunit A [Planctomycetes bacterium]|nr:V-type ATP synthase subunit A [Planctomycetota bacterium]